jgi:hypothetical protein
MPSEQLLSVERRSPKRRGLAAVPSPWLRLVFRVGARVAQIAAEHEVRAPRQRVELMDLRAEALTLARRRSLVAAAVDVDVGEVDELAGRLPAGLRLRQVPARSAVSRP